MALSWVGRDWLSNNVTLGALVEVQREAVHSHRKSWCAGRQSDSRTSVVTAGDCRTPNQVPTASLLRAGVSRFQCNRPRGKLPRSAREMKDATADVHRRARWDGVRNAFTGSRDRISTFYHAHGPGLARITNHCLRAADQRLRRASVLHLQSVRLVAKPAQRIYYR